MPKHNGTANSTRLSMALADLPLTPFGMKSPVSGASISQKKSLNEDEYSGKFSRLRRKSPYESLPASPLVASCNKENFDYPLDLKNVNTRRKNKKTLARNMFQGKSNFRTLDEIETLPNFSLGVDLETIGDRNRRDSVFTDIDEGSFIEFTENHEDNFIPSISKENSIPLPYNENLPHLYYTCTDNNSTKYSTSSKTPLTPVGFQKFVDKLKSENFLSKTKGVPCKVKEKYDTPKGLFKFDESVIAASQDLLFLKKQNRGHNIIMNSTEYLSNRSVIHELPDISTLTLDNLPTNSQILNNSNNHGFKKPLNNENIECIVLSESDGESCEKERNFMRYNNHQVSQPHRDNKANQFNSSLISEDISILSSMPDTQKQPKYINKPLKKNLVNVCDNIASLEWKNKEIFPKEAELKDQAQINNVAKTDDRIAGWVLNSPFKDGSFGTSFLDLKGKKPLQKSCSKPLNFMDNSVQSSAVRLSDENSSSKGSGNTVFTLGRIAELPEKQDKLPIIAALEGNEFCENLEIIDRNTDDNDCEKSHSQFVKKADHFSPVIIYSTDSDDEAIKGRRNNNYNLIYSSDNSCKSINFRPKKNLHSNKFKKIYNSSIPVSLVLSSSDDEDYKTNKITSKKTVEAVGGKYSHSFSNNKVKDGASKLKYHSEMDKHDSTSNGTSISKLRLSDELASQNSTSHSDSSMQKGRARSLKAKQDISCVENVNHLISTSNNSNTNSIILHVNKLVLESDSCDESPPSVNSKKDSSKSKLIKRLPLNFSSDSQSDANEEKPLSNFNSERKLYSDSLRDSLPDVDVNSGSNLCLDPSGHSSPELDTRKKPANSGLNICLDSSSNSSPHLDVRKKMDKLKSDLNTSLDSSNNSLPDVNVIKEPAEFKSGPNLCLDSSYDSLPDVDIKKNSLAKSQNQFLCKPISQNVQNKNFGKFSKKIVPISSSESSGEDNFQNYINSARKITQDLRKKKQSAKSPVADENFIVPDSDEEYFSTSSATPPPKPKRIPQNTQETTSTPALSRNMKWRNTPRIILDSSSDDEDYLLKKKGNKKVKPKIPKLKETTNSSSKCLSGPLSFLGSLTMDIPLNKVHPDALPFVKNFKKEKESLTEKLYQYFNSHVFTNHLPSSMNIKWNPRLTKTAGYCYYQMDKSKPSGRGARIELSTKVIDAPGRLRDTLIHELCHAASWIISGYKDGHGPLWKSWASKAMCMFPELPLISRCHSYDINCKYTYKCNKCGYSIGRHSKSLDTEKKVCGYCYGKFELLVNYASKNPSQTSHSAKKAINSIPKATPSTPRTPSAFALFVKENYGFMKRTQTASKHGDIMKALGQEFAKLKAGNN